MITCLKCGNRFKAGNALIVKSEEAAKNLDEKIVDMFNSTKSIIHTVKFYHDETNTSLADAKKYVDDLLSSKNIDWKTRQVLVVWSCL